MRFATYEANGMQHVGILVQEDKYVLPLTAAAQAAGIQVVDDMISLIEQGDAKLSALRDAAAQVGEEQLLPIEDIRLLAPIPKPRKNIFCIGKNYVEHALEFEKTTDVNAAVPKVPVIFSKPPTCVVGTGATVKNHRHMTSQMDYEVELAVIIGKTASQVSKETAYDYVFGYTVMNDVSARDLQKAHSQWIMGKGPDTFAPMGPCIVDKSEISDPHNLYIKCAINGELRQNSNTKDMVFDIPTLIATLSSVITLEPGDIIATGTPAGVGVGFNPPKFLQPGDQMRLEIENIGVLVNCIER